MIELISRKIGKGQPVFIIAEAGVNHNGNIDTARKLIDVAKEAGVDAIKFQTFKTEELVTVNSPRAEYQKKTTDKNETQYDMLKKLELSAGDHCYLKKYCDDNEIIFMSTPFDFSSVELLNSLGVEIFKIGSGDITNLPLLEYLSQKQKPLILSTGMSNLGEVEEAVNCILNTGNTDLILLHCVSNYPAKYKVVNLRAVDTLRESFKLPVGYSDHTKGVEVAVAAVARGAVVIEKHFTLDKDMQGPDHNASLLPCELKDMVNKIRNVEKSLGDGIKKCQFSEEETRLVARKSIVSNKRINKGEIIEEEKLSIKRPAGGIKPGRLNDVVDKARANRDIEKDSIIKWEDITFE